MDASFYLLPIYFLVGAVLWGIAVWRNVKLGLASTPKWWMKTTLVWLPLCLLFGPFFWMGIVAIRIRD